MDGPILPGGEDRPSRPPAPGLIGDIDRSLRSWGVEYDLFLPKLAYLSMIGSFGAVVPFLSVFFKFAGIPIEQIGLLMTIRPAASFIASPIWAAVADRFGIYKILLLFSLIGSALLRVSMIWVTGFWGLAALMVFIEFIGAPSSPLMDATVMKILGEERRQHYGKQRLWGGTLNNPVAKEATHAVHCFSCWIRHQCALCGLPRPQATQPVLVLPNFCRDYARRSRRRAAHDSHGSEASFWLLVESQDRRVFSKSFDLLCYCVFHGSRKWHPQQLRCSSHPVAF